MTKSLNNLQPFGALLMRLALGVTMAVRGYEKVIPHGALNHHVHYITSLGLPHVGDDGDAVVDADEVRLVVEDREFTVVIEDSYLVAALRASRCGERELFDLDPVRQVEQNVLGIVFKEGAKHRFCLVHEALLSLREHIRPRSHDGPTAAAISRVKFPACPPVLALELDP